MTAQPAPFLTTRRGMLNITVFGASGGTGSHVVLFDKNNNAYLYGLDTSPMAKGDWKLSLNLGDGVDRSLVITIN